MDKTLSTALDTVGSLAALIEALREQPETVNAITVQPVGDYERYEQLACNAHISGVFQYIETEPCRCSGGDELCGDVDSRGYHVTATDVALEDVLRVLGIEVDHVKLFLAVHSLAMAEKRRRTQLLDAEASTPF
jgi:hypothetical protein